MLFNEIDELVIHRKIDDHVGIAQQEVAQRRHQMTMAEAHWRADTQFSTGRRPHLFDSATGVFEIGQDPRCAFEIGVSGFGQAQRSCGPMQEAGSKLAFEVADLAADRGFRDPKATSGLGKRLRVCHGHK